MDRVTVSVSFRKDDLDRLDTWRVQRRQARGAAIMSLLDLVDGRVSERQRVTNFYMERAQESAEHLDDINAAGGGFMEKKEDLPLIRSPEDKAAALEALRPKMAEKPNVRGIHETNVEKRSDDWPDEFDQSGRTDDDR